MAGIGNSSCGIFPFGVGTPVTSAAPPTGNAGSRYLNPSTRDFQRDTLTGQLAQGPAVRMRVLLALLTLQGSSTVAPKFGVRWPRKIDESYEQSVTDSIRKALHHLTTVERVIVLNEVAVTKSGFGRVEAVVSYTDVTTGQPDQVSTAL